MTVNFPMSPDTYVGPKTPFGGPSLEWEFSNITITTEESEEKARLTAHLPVSISGNLTHLRKMLTQEYPRTEANIQRKVLSTGIPIIEGFLELHPYISWRQEAAFQSMKSTRRTKDYQMKTKSIYVVDLGPVEGRSSPSSVYARNQEQTNKVRNMAKDTGLTLGDITILCLAAGLAQSVDPAWVPVALREDYVEEVKCFCQWLEASK